jgi:hypothetical protein
MSRHLHDALEGIGLLLADCIDHVRPTAARCVRAAASLALDIGMDLVALSWRLSDVADRVAPVRRPAPKPVHHAPFDPRINVLHGGRA